MPISIQPPPMYKEDMDGKNEMHETGGMKEICVPVSSLAMPGEDDKLNNPAQGDPVQFHVEGKVSRIEGDNAYVTMENVNGKPLNAEAAKTTNTPEQNPDAEFAALQQEASQMKM